jgi:hypothetical protein
MNELELICGDPENVEKGASYTRFIIPFAYRLRERGKEETKPPHSYQDVTNLSDLCWRKKYLTCETGKVLFETAQWFKLEPSKENSFPIEIEFNLDRKISAVVTAPQLILFEFPKDGKAEDEGWDILQVGFLILEIHFDKDAANKPTLDDLIKINELFRYFDKPFDTHYEDKKLGKFLDNDSLKRLLLQKEVKNARDSFYERWWRLLDDVQINDKWLIEYAGKTGAKSKENPKNTYPDNRTFVWTCAILPEGAKHLWRTFKDNGRKASSYGHWIKLLNIDEPGVTPDATHQSREFERKWADKHTYHRWEEWGTYYGFTPHSGALLGPQFSEPPLWKHFGQMYFDQVLLLLYLRAVLFRFSAKLSEISRDARDNHQQAKEKWAKDFQELRWRFALFTNLYQFPLLSNQQQGIEMYTLARECMEVDDLFKEVQEEIHNSHDFLQQQQQHKLNKLTNDLQREQQEQNRLLVKLQEEQQRKNDETERQNKLVRLLTVVATFGLIISIAITFLSVGWNGWFAELFIRRNISYIGRVLWFVMILLFTVLLFALIVRNSVWFSTLLEKLAFPKENTKLEENQKEAGKAQSKED